MTASRCKGGWVMEAAGTSILGNRWGFSLACIERQTWLEVSSSQPSKSFYLPFYPSNWGSLNTGPSCPTDFTFRIVLSLWMRSGCLPYLPLVSSYSGQGLQGALSRMLASGWPPITQMGSSSQGQGQQGSPGVTVGVLGSEWGMMASRSLPFLPGPSAPVWPWGHH